MKKLLVPLAIASLFAAQPALADSGRGHLAYYEQHSNGGVEARLARQLEAVERGVARGVISRQESWRLRAENQQIDRAWRVATGDGNYTRQERAHVEHMLSDQARQIRRAMRDYDDPRYEY
jgi:multidrug resistance efflux pump